MLEVIKFAFV